MPEANSYSAGTHVDFTPTAALSAGEVVHVPDGRAGYTPSDVAAGVKGAVQVTGIASVAKTASMVMLAGSPVYWDVSAGKATLNFGADTADFYLGVVQEAATSSATTVKVQLNEKPRWTLSLADGYASVPISTAGFPQIAGAGNGVNLIMDTAVEAQKLDALSLRGVATDTPGMLYAEVCINTNGDDAAFDLNVGMANATHATDADTITESLFAHVDGASTDINLESDDGTTEVAATDSTVDFTAGTPFVVQWDLADWTDPQVYIDGVNVLSASVFNITAATGPMKLLAHMEKSSNDSPGNVSVMCLGFVAYDT